MTSFDLQVQNACGKDVAKVERSTTDRRPGDLEGECCAAPLSAVPMLKLISPCAAFLLSFLFSGDEGHEEVGLCMRSNKDLHSQSEDGMPAIVQVQGVAMPTCVPQK